MSKPALPEQQYQRVRFPLDPITITDSYMLMAITVGGMLNEISAEHYLMELIDQHASELHDDLTREMFRPSRIWTPEEYAAYLAQQQ